VPCRAHAPKQVVQKAADIQEAISEGANSFLFTEYKYLGIFMVRVSAGWLARRDRCTRAVPIRDAPSDNTLSQTHPHQRTPPPPYR
jgi:hypothetical protein